MSCNYMRFEPRKFPGLNTEEDQRLLRELMDARGQEIFTAWMPFIDAARKAIEKAGANIGFRDYCLDNISGNVGRSLGIEMGWDVSKEGARGRQAVLNVLGEILQSEPSA